MCLLKLDDISFSYNHLNNGNDFSLTEINISVDKGEFITILGPNGSGKSTLLKLVTGILNPEKGKITLSKLVLKDYSKKELAKKLAFVPQNSVSIFPFSVYEIVMMGRTPYLNFAGFEKREDHLAVENALETVGISHLKRKGINEVSGGEAQRAFIARALVQEPEIILLDEPNAHLDIKHQISIFNLLNEFNKKNKLTVIAVSHDLNLSGSYSDRGILMKSGKVFLDDVMKNILTEENIMKVFEVNSSVYRERGTKAVNVMIKP